LRSLPVESPDGTPRPAWGRSGTRRTAPWTRGRSADSVEPLALDTVFIAGAMVQAIDPPWRVCVSDIPEQAMGDRRLL